MPFDVGQLGYSPSGPPWGFLILEIQFDDIAPERDPKIPEE